MIEISERIKAIPPYIFAQIDEAKAAAAERGIDIIDLGIGDPDIPTPTAIVDEMAKAIRKPENHNYPPYQGTPAFRQSVARWYKSRFNVDLDPNSEVLSLIGSKEGIAHACLSYLDAGDVALLPDPGYPAYQVGVLIAGGEPVLVPVTEENGYMPDLEAIDAATLEKARIIFLNFPGNPTGAVASDEFFKSAIAWAKKHNILIAMDLAYSEVYYDNEKPKSILEFEGGKDVAIEFHTLSKTFNMTGWRVGMAVGNQTAIQTLGKIKTNMDSGVFKAIQDTAIYALDHYEDFIPEQNKLFQERRDIVVEGLTRCGWDITPPKASYYIWTHIPSNYSSAQKFAIDLLEETGILVVPGTGYGERGEGYFRISITTPTDRLREAMKRLETHNVRFRETATA
mgnify:CR=1 FL=1